VACTSFSRTMTQVAYKFWTSSLHASANEVLITRSWMLVWTLASLMYTGRCRPLQVYPQLVILP